MNRHVCIFALSIARIPLYISCAASEQKKFEVHILKHVANIRINDTTTVKELKELIASKEGIPAEHQSLFKKELVVTNYLFLQAVYIPLEDTKTCRDYGIKDTSKLFLRTSDLGKK